jgi:hypothetical protein
MHLLQPRGFRRQVERRAQAAAILRDRGRIVADVGREIE